MYESVHASLERTLAGRSDQSEDENGSDQSEAEKHSNGIQNSNQTPTEISDFDD